MIKFIPKLIYCTVFFLVIILFQGQSFGYDREIKDLTESLLDQVTKSGKKSIAVVDFVDLQGNPTELGRFISEEISVNFTVNDKNIEIVDRNHLKSLMKEHKFSTSGLVDPNAIKKLGKIAGVDALVTGTVTLLDDNARITCKVIATDTAKIIGGGRIDIAKTKAIEELGASEISDGKSSIQTEKKSTRQGKESDDASVQSSSTSQTPIYRIVPVMYGGKKHDELTRELADAISGVPFAKVEIGGQPRSGDRIVSVAVSKLSDRVIDNPDHAGAAMARQFFGKIVDDAMANIPKKLIEVNAQITVVANDNIGGRITEEAEIIYRTNSKKGSSDARDRAVSESTSDAVGRLVIRLSGGIPSKKTVRIIDDYPKQSTSDGTQSKGD